MEIFCIFEIDDQGLYTFKFNNTTEEFKRVFDLWSDVEYLEAFFEKNKSDLFQWHGGKISIEKAVIETHSEAKRLRNFILGCEHGENKLDDIFQPLHQWNLFPDKPEFSKAYNLSDTWKWLRVYALKIDDNVYIVTGGSIKLTKAMQARSHTQKELNKLKDCSDYIVDNKKIEE